MKFENLLPVAAPAPPAVVLGIMLYNEIISASSPDWWPIAAVASMLGVVGMIGAEMYSYRQAMIAFAEREFVAMLAALGGAILTSGLIVYAIYRSDNSRPLVVSVLVAIVGYMVLAVRDYLVTKREHRREHRDALIEDANRDADNQVRLLDARRNLVNAETRQARVSSGVQRVSKVSSGQVDTARAARVREAWRQNPGVSQREIARICGVSPMTAGKYKP